MVHSYPDDGANVNRILLAACVLAVGLFAGCGKPAAGGAAKPASKDVKAKKRYARAELEKLLVGKQRKRHSIGMSF